MSSSIPTKPHECGEDYSFVREGYRCLFGDRCGRRPSCGVLGGGGSSSHSSYYSYNAQQVAVLECALTCLQCIIVQAVEAVFEYFVSVSDSSGVEMGSADSGTTQVDSSESSTANIVVDESPVETLADTGVARSDLVADVGDLVAEDESSSTSSVSFDQLVDSSEENKSLGKTITVFAKQLVGNKYHKIEILDNSPVAKLKDAIYDLEAVPSDKQRLMFCGKELEGNCTLSQAAIVNESNINLLLRGAVVGGEGGGNEIQVPAPPGSLGVGFRRNTAGHCIVNELGENRARLELGDIIMSVNGIDLSEIEGGKEGVMNLFRILFLQEEKTLVLLRGGIKRHLDTSRENINQNSKKQRKVNDTAETGYVSEGLQEERSDLNDVANNKYDTTEGEEDRLALPPSVFSSEKVRTYRHRSQLYFKEAITSSIDARYMTGVISRRGEGHADPCLRMLEMCTKKQNDMVASIISMMKSGKSVNLIEYLISSRTTQDLAQLRNYLSLTPPPIRILSSPPDLVDSSPNNDIDSDDDSLPPYVPLEYDPLNESQKDAALADRNAPIEAWRAHNTRLLLSDATQQASDTSQDTDIFPSPLTNTTTQEIASPVANSRSTIIKDKDRRLLTNKEESDLNLILHGPAMISEDGVEEKVDCILQHVLSLARNQHTTHYIANEIMKMCQDSEVAQIMAEEATIFLRDLDRLLPSDVSQQASITSQDTDISPPADSAILELCRESLVERGLSNFTALLENLHSNQGDALCTIRRSITSKLETLCNVDCENKMDEFVDSIMEQISVEYEANLVGVATAVYKDTIELEEHGCSFSDAWDTGKSFLMEYRHCSEELAESIITEAAINHASEDMFQPSRRTNSPVIPDTKEQKSIKAGAVAQLLDPDILKYHPKSAVFATKAVKILQEYDPLTIAEGHCETSQHFNRIGLHVGQTCAEHCCMDDILNNESIQNLLLFSQGFASNIDWGRVIKNVLGFNFNSMCTLTEPEWSTCPRNPMGEGKAMAKIINILEDTCTKLKVCFNLTLYAGNCGPRNYGIDKSFFPFLNDTVPCCHKEDQGGVDNYHLVNNTIECLAWGNEQQMSIMTNAIKGITDYQEKRYQHFESLYDCQIDRPPMNAHQYALADERMSFVNLTIEDVGRSLTDKQRRTKSCVDWFRTASSSTGVYNADTLIHKLILPPDCKRWVSRYKSETERKFGLESFHEMTVYHVLSVMGDHSVELQCKKLNCTTKELMEMVLETGAKNLGCTVEDIRRVAGENSVKAQCKKNNCTTKDLMKKALETGAANSGRTVEDINRLGGENGTTKGMKYTKQSLLDVDFSQVGVQQLRSGNWSVRVLYQGEHYGIGSSRTSFLTRDQAAVANEAARRSLEPTRNDDLTTEEIEANIALARDAAHVAVHGTTFKFDFRNTGVTQLNSGNWQVYFRYHNMRRSYGTYETQDEAALANEAARRSLERTRNGVLTPEEIEANITLALRAAQEAVYGEESDSD